MDQKTYGLAIRSDMPWLSFTGNTSGTAKGGSNINQAHTYSFKLQKSSLRHLINGWKRILATSSGAMFCNRSNQVNVFLALYGIA